MRAVYFKLPGAACFEVAGQTQLIFGQKYEGRYLHDGSYQKYTSQVRTFDIDYDHTAGTLRYSNGAVYPAGGDPSQFRRRDLNTFPILSKDGTGADQRSGVALSGSLLWGQRHLDGTCGNKPYRHSLNARPCNRSPSIFKQALNGYESAKLGMYSTATGEMTELLFGGITANEYVNDPIAGNLIYAGSFPFTNQISAVTIDPSGQYDQTYVGDYPLLYSPAGTRYLFGSNAEFFPSADIAFARGRYHRPGCAL